MSVDIISLELFLGKADSCRHSEKFRYILSFLRYTRLKRICVGISKNFSRQYVFHCLQLFVIKKCAVLKFFRKNIVYLQILSLHKEIFIFSVFQSDLIYEYYT